LLVLSDWAPELAIGNRQLATHFFDTGSYLLVLSDCAPELAMEVFEVTKDFPKEEKYPINSIRSHHLIRDYDLGCQLPIAYLGD